MLSKKADMDISLKTIIGLVLGALLLWILFMAAKPILSLLFK